MMEQSIEQCISTTRSGTKMNEVDVPCKSTYELIGGGCKDHRIDEVDLALSNMAVADEKAGHGQLTSHAAMMQVDPEVASRTALLNVARRPGVAHGREKSPAW